MKHSSRRVLTGSIRLAVHAALIVGAISLLSVTGESQPAGNRNVGSVPREVSIEVTRIFNSPLTRRIRGDFVLASGDTVRSDVAVLNGSARISGVITGSLVVLNGDASLAGGARIDRSLTVVGGTFESPDRPDVGGDISIWSARYRYHESGDTLVAETDVLSRWSGWVRDSREGPESDLFVAAAHTYNRVEGLPIVVGPRFSVRNGNTQVRGELFGIFRTGDKLDWKRENLGHRVMLELREGRRHGVAVGGRLFDEVDAMQDWQLTNTEVGLNTFLFTRDYRDYWQRHGGEATLAVFSGNSAELRAGFGRERWSSRRTLNVWSLFNEDIPWRTNPSSDEGVVDLFTLTATYDTRNNPVNPRSGWYLRGHLEHASGSISTNGQLTENVRTAAVTVPLNEPLSYSRLFLDLRRYNRLGPGSQINFRLVAGGWVDGDPLPVQKRLSVSGLDALPGFGFRQFKGGTDVGTCATGSDSVYRSLGRPAQCERIVLMQAEWKGDFRINLFGDDDYGDSRWRFNGLHADGALVVFVNSGRGWLIHSASGLSEEHKSALHYGSTRLPSVSTWRTDIGGGFDFGDFGVYLAQAVSESGLSPRVYVRLSRRF